MQAPSQTDQVVFFDCIPGDEALRSKIREAILLLEEESVTVTLSSDVAWQVLAFALSRADFPLIFDMISPQLQDHERHLQDILWLTFRSIYRDDVDDYQQVSELLEPWVPITSDRSEWAEYFSKNKEQFATAPVLQGNTGPLEAIFLRNSSECPYRSDIEIAVRVKSWEIVEYLCGESYWDSEMMDLAQQGITFPPEIAPLYVLSIVWLGIGSLHQMVTCALAARDHHVMRAALSRQWETRLLDDEMEQLHIDISNAAIAQEVAIWCNEKEVWEGKFNFASQSDIIEYILGQCLDPNDSYSFCYLAGFTWAQGYDESLLLKILERVSEDSVELHRESESEQLMELIFQRYPPQDDQLKRLLWECCLRDDENKAMFFFRKNPPLLIQQFDDPVYHHDEDMVDSHCYHFAIETACFGGWSRENILFMFESGAYEARENAEDLGECPVQSILEHADDELIQWTYNAGYAQFPLHGLCRSRKAAAVSCAQKFLDQHETDLDGCNQSPLHVACASGNLEMVELLRSRPASEQFLTHRDTKGNTPLFLAVRTGKSSVARKILPLVMPAGDISSLHHTDTDQSNLLHICANYNPRLLPEIIPLMNREHFNAKSTSFLLKEYSLNNCKENVPLLFMIHNFARKALKKGESLDWFLEVVKMFIDKGGRAQILEPNKAKLTAWHALFRGKGEIYFPLFEYFLEQVAESFHADDAFVRQLSRSASLDDVPVIVELLRHQMITNEQFDKMTLIEGVREAVQREIGARKKAKSVR